MIRREKKVAIMRPVSFGDRGKEVVDIQTRLRALDFHLGSEGADGHFGPNTERAVRGFQQQRWLEMDGIVGENTWTELVEAGHQVGERLLYLRVPAMRGDDVLLMQRMLNELGFDSGPVDGIFGEVTENALLEFQRNAGVNLDGIVGEATLAQLRRIRMAGVGTSDKKIPDRMDGYVGSRSLAGLKICIDPAHGGTDFGARGVGGLTEKSVNLQLAQQVAELLRAHGTDVMLVRDDDRFIGLYERLERANSFQGDLHLTVHHGHHDTPVAQGAAAFFFENGSYFAEAGKRLAGYLIQALVRDAGRVDLHTHGRNFACLREPRRLAVMVEPGFITHPEEGGDLADGPGIRREAEALIAGIRSYLERL